MPRINLICFIKIVRHHHRINRKNHPRLWTQFFKVNVCIDTVVSSRKLKTKTT